MSTREQVKRDRKNKENGKKDVFLIQTAFCSGQTTQLSKKLNRKRNKYLSTYFTYAKKKCFFLPALSVGEKLQHLMTSETNVRYEHACMAREHRSHTEYIIDVRRYSHGIRPH